MNGEAATTPGGESYTYLRFPLSTRLLHWIAAAAVFTLLWSGFWIFNIHPRLYWGEVGYFGAPAVAEIAADTSGDEPSFEIRVGDLLQGISRELQKEGRFPSHNR